MDKIANLLVALPDSPLYFLFNWSWRAALLLAIVWLTLKFDRSKTAVVRHRIWLFGLIAVAILPLGAAVGDFVPMPRAGPLTYVAEIPSAIKASLLAAPPRTGRAPAVGAANDLEPASSKMPENRAPVVWWMLFFAWVAGALISLGRYCLASGRVRGICKRAREVSLGEVDCAGIDWCPQSRIVKIGLSPEVQSPVLAGLLRPMILLPEDICSWTNADERIAILRHEWIHLRRRDHCVVVFQALLSAVFFFHPMVRYASSRLNVERELACDEGVLNLGTRAAVYAESILKVVERNTLPDAVHQPAAFVSRKTLEARIEMITGLHRSPMSRHWPFLILPFVLITMVSWLLLSGPSAAAGSLQLRDGARGEVLSDGSPQRFDRGLRDFTAGGAMPSASEILDRYVEALGGEAAIENISSRVVSGTMEGEDLQGARSGTFQEYTKAPNKYLMVKGPSRFGDLKVGFNGGDGWRWTEYWGLEGDWDDYDGGLAKRGADFYRDVRLKTIYPKMVVIGKGVMDGREIFMLEGSPDSPGESIVDRLYFDARTGLLLRLNHKIEGWKHVFEDYFEDYRDVDGVKMPFIRRRTSPDRYVVKVIEVSHGVPINDAEFDPPVNNLTQGMRRLFYGKLHLRNPFRRNLR